MDKVSNQYLTATVTGLVVAILFSLTAIIVRSIAAPEMDGKISAECRAFQDASLNAKPPPDDATQRETVDGTI